MKNLIVAMALVLGTTSVKAYEVPKDAVIKVFDSKGKEIGSMTRAEYKVVKIENDAVIEARKEKVYQDVRKDKQSGTLVVHVGGGKTGLQTTSDGSKHTVEDKFALVAGATLCYNRGNKGICATGLSNQTYTLGVKFDLE